jgi:Membrane protein involved in the export of O-antigen and teichoic acid
MPTPIENPPNLASAVLSTDSADASVPVATKEDRYQDHFRTDHLLTNLKGRTIRSGAVTISAQAGKFLLSLVSTMILARLLTPRDFGLVAMVTTVTGFLRVFKDAGLSIATVQKERITHAQVSNLFWINVAISAATSLVIVAAAPAVAWFYHNHRLINIMLLLSLTFIISGSTIQHQALLKRQMRFKSLALIDLSSMAFGVFVGVLMALRGCRYWSLVGSNLAMETAGLVLTWTVSRWRPQLPTRHSGIRPMVSFGAHRAGGDFILALARGTDNLLIGRFYGSDSVGLYSRASALLIQPLQQFLLPVNAVFLPALSRLQSEPARYRSTFLRVYEAIALAGFAFTGLFLALARPITLVLLGPKWIHAAVIVGGFTVAAFCLPLSNAAGWLFTSQGRGRDMFVAQVISAVFTVLSFLAGLPFGPVGVAIAYSLCSLLVRIPLYYYSVGRSGPVRTADLWIIFFRHLPVWAIVFFTTWGMLIMTSKFPPFSQLMVCGPVGLLSGAVAIGSFRSHRKVAAHLLETLRELKQGR